jgi:hypothetical protein
MTFSTPEIDTSLPGRCGEMAVLLTVQKMETKTPSSSTHFTSTHLPHLIYLISFFSSRFRLWPHDIRTESSSADRMRIALLINSDLSNASSSSCETTEITGLPIF